MEKNTLQQRYFFIELLAYWEGRINSKDMERQFNQSRQQSSADINSYKEQAPQNLEYDSSKSRIRFIVKSLPASN